MDTYIQIVRLLIEDCLCDPAVKTKVGATPLDAAKTGVAEYLTSIMNVVSSKCVIRSANTSHLLDSHCKCVWSNSNAVIMHGR